MGHSEAHLRHLERLGSDGAGLYKWLPKRFPDFSYGEYSEPEPAEGGRLEELRNDWTDDEDDGVNA